MDLEIELGGVEIEIKGLRGLITVLALTAAAAALARELALPPERRTWHGLALGFVPYDFRPPCINRLRSTLWDPANEHVLVPHAIGVGWTVNLGAVAKKLGLLD